MAVKKKQKGERKTIGEILRDDVPDSDVVPDGGYLATVANMEFTETGQNAQMPGCKMVKAQYSVVAPKEYKGCPLFDNFVLGNEDDPDARKPSTWKASRGWKSLKKLLAAAQIPLEGDEDDICDAAKGKTVFLVVICQTQEKGEYKGMEQNRVRGYYAEGEREPEVTGEVTVSAKKSVKAAMKKRAAEDDDDSDGEEEEEEEEKPKRGRGRPKGSKNKKAKAEEEEEEEEEDEDEDEGDDDDDEEEDEGDDEDDEEEEDEDEDDDEEEEKPRPKGKRR